MKIIFTIALVFMTVINISCQNSPDSYLSKFKPWPEELITQYKSYSHKTLSKEYFLLTKEDVLKFISNDPNEIQFNYVNYNEDDLNDSTTGVAFYDYYALFTKRIGDFYYNVYVKTQYEDSTMVYLQIMNQEGKRMQSILLHKTVGEDPFQKAFIDNKFNIIIGYYSPSKDQTLVEIKKYALSETSKKIETITKKKIVVNGFFLDFLSNPKNENDPMFE